MQLNVRSAMRLFIAVLLMICGFVRVRVWRLMGGQEYTKISGNTEDYENLTIELTEDSSDLFRDWAWGLNRYGICYREAEAPKDFGINKAISARIVEKPKEVVKEEIKPVEEFQAVTEYKPASKDQHLKFGIVGKSAISIDGTNISMVKTYNKKAGYVTICACGADLIDDPVIDGEEVPATDMCMTISYRLAKQLFNIMKHVNCED